MSLRITKSQISGKNRNLNHWINGGIYIISPEVFDYFLEVEKGDLEKLVFPKLAKKGLINAYKENCFWKSVDSLKDLEEVRKEFKNRTDKPWGYEKLIEKKELFRKGNVCDERRKTKNFSRKRAYFYENSEGKMLSRYEREKYYS